MAYQIVDWVIARLPNDLSSIRSKKDLQKYLEEKMDKDGRLIKYMARSDWYGDPSPDGNTIQDIFKEESKQQLKDATTEEELLAAKTYAEKFSFSDVVKDIEAKLAELENKFKKAKSKIIADAGEIKNRSDADKVYDEIQELPDSPDRTAQIRELDQLVAETFGSLEEEFIRNVGSEDSISRLEDMRIDAPTSDAEEELNRRISELEERQ